MVLDLRQGDALKILKDIPDKHVNCVVTSPPYWALRDYDVDEQIGLEITPEKYIDNLCNIFDEIKRVLKNDGTCWVNIGDTYMGNSSYSNEGRAGFNSKDGNTKKWVRTSGNGKCLLCGKPTEKQFCSRECLNKKGNAFRSQNRILPNKTLVGIPFMFALEMIKRGWILRNTIIWHKPNAMPSSSKDRFTVDFEYLFFFVKKQKYYFETQYEPLQKVSIKRSEYGWNGQVMKNNHGHSGTTKMDKMGTRFVNPELGRIKRTTWTINTQGSKEAHFAVYPEKLCKYPIKAGCPEGGIVLDPFMGSGTTGIVAIKQNKKFIGIELNKKYIDIANKRFKRFFEEELIVIDNGEIKKGLDKWFGGVL